MDAGSATPASGPEPRQQARLFSLPGGETLAYLLHLPPADPGGGPPPLVLFLHGAGERGHDLELVKRHGIPRVIETRADFPFVAVSPQCPPGRYWTDLVTECAALLEAVLARRQADPERVYLTGLSMGGYGTWHLAAAIPGRLAAVAPICGGGLHAAGFPRRVCDLGDLPVWAFHGERDTVVPPAESRLMVRELERCGGNVRLTVYPDLGHDAWTRTYDDPELYRWLLSWRRGADGRARSA